MRSDFQQLLVKQALCRMQAAVQTLAGSLGHADWAVKAVLPAARHAEQEYRHSRPRVCHTVWP